MKIALFATESRSLHSYSGGVGVRYEDLCVALASAGLDVTFVTTTHNIIHGAVWPHSNVKVVVLDIERPRTPLYPLREALRVSNFFNKSKFDVVLAPEWRGHLAFASDSTARHLVTNLATSSRQIRELSDGARLTLSQRVSAAAVDWLERRQTLRSVGVVAISESLLRWSRRLWGKLPQSVVVLNGIDVNQVVRSHADSDWVLERLDAGTVVVAVGRVSHWKGSVTLLDAMERVWEVVPEARLLYIGAVQADVEAEIRDRVSTHNASHPNRVELAGARPREEMLTVLRGARVAVFASHFEGFGNACLEAKILGVPVVATSGSGFSEFCTNDEDALLVEPGRSDALAGAIASLLVDEKLRTRIAKTGSLRSMNFDSADYVTRLLFALNAFGFSHE